MAKKSIIALVLMTVLTFFLTTIACSGAKTEPQVVKPAEFKLSSLVVTPNEVIIGHQVTATVEVSNIGDLSGNYTCSLAIDGVVAQKEEVTLEGGASKTVAFNFTPGQRGTRQLTVGNLTQTISVLKPAEFTLSSLLISPDEVVPGSNVTVSATVANSGDMEGDAEIELLFNGKTVSQNETLAGNEKKTVSFSVLGEAIGLYDIRASIKLGIFHYSSLNGTLAVIPTAPVEFKNYVDLAYKFFVVYPEGWEQENMSDDFVAFYGPVDKNIATSFIVGKENIFLLAAVSGKLTIVYETPLEVIRRNLDSMRQTLPGFREISTEELKVNNVPAARGTFFFSVGGTEIKGQILAIIFDKSNCFVLNFTASQATYDNNRKTFDIIVNSLTPLKTYK